MKRTALGLTLISVLLITFAFVPSLKAVSEAPKLQWSKTYGPYTGHSVVQTNDEGYIIAGQNATYGVHGYNDYEPSIIKTDSSGQVQWRTVIPSGGYAVSVVQTKDLGYAIGCNPNGLLVKIDSEGNIQWNKTFGLASCYVFQTSDGDYVIAGSQRNTNNSDDAVLIKTDENGNKLWNKTFNFGFITWVTTFVETDAGGYALSGDGNWFMKTNANGDLLWNQTYNLPFVNTGTSVTSIANTNDGGYILAGLTGYGVGTFLIKTDTDGHVEWSNYFEKSSFSSAIQDSDGEYTTVGIYNEKYAIVKADTDGHIVWNASVEGYPYSVIQTNDGSYVVTGIANSLGGMSDIFLAKFSLESAIPPDETSPPFSTTLIVVAVIIVSVVGLGLLFYFRKRKRQTEMRNSMK